MPFLAIAHLREARCPECDALLAQPGARSFIVGPDGFPVFFDPGDPPAELTVEIGCPNGHALTLLLPNDVAAEETGTIPDRAPIGPDARLRTGTSESGKPL